MIPAEDSLDFENVAMYRQPSKTYRLINETVSGKIDGKEAVQQAIYHILATERFANPIYDDNYGVELEQYIGADYGFIVAGIEETLRDALTQDDRILSVTVDDISKKENSCTVVFTVKTIFGDLQEAVNVL